jgi:hypothetical protein
MPVTDLDLRRLRYLVTVADELGFVRAAALLSVTHPALASHPAGSANFADIPASVTSEWSMYHPMPELDEFGKLAASMPGNGGKNELRP